MSKLRVGGALAAVMVLGAAFTAAAHSVPTAPPAPVAAAHSLETALQVALNDTIVPVFSASADTVFTIVPVASPTGVRSALRAQRCGHTQIYLRVYAYGSAKAFGRILKADTLPIVSCAEIAIPPTPLASVASVTVCVNADTLAFNALHVEGDTTTDPAKVPCLASSPIDSGTTTQATAVARDSAGNVLTGRHISWQIIDQPAAPGAMLREAFTAQGRRSFIPIARSASASDGGLH